MDRSRLSLLAVRIFNARSIPVRLFVCGPHREVRMSLQHEREQEEVRRCKQQETLNRRDKKADQSLNKQKEELKKEKDRLQYIEEIITTGC